MLNAFRITSVFLAVLIVLPATSLAAQTAPLTARQVYSKALSAMSGLHQPHYLTYDVEGTSDGLQVDLIVLRGQLWLNIHRGAAPARWSLRHRTYDYQSELVNQSDGKRYLTQRSFFDPTWYGAIRALRLGMFDSQDPSAPVVSRPSPPPDADMKTIAAVTVMGPGIYSIQDRGSAPCPSGTPGRALHLASRDSDPQHQLSDVIVDMQSMRFCMMRFSLGDAFGFHGIMEEYYGDVGEYWLQTGGMMDGTIRAFGISLHHGKWHYKIVNVQFPESLPADAFAQNPTSSGRKH